MNTPSDPDWTLIRFFLAVAEAGSLSAAARDLGLSQPTLTRRIREAERVLGGPLFRRHARGLALTEAGAALVEDARRMRDAAARLGMTAAGHGGAPRGTVRITASGVVSFHFLPPILAGLRAQEPEIELELHPSNASENLLFREADIAVRMYRPEQLDLVARHLGTVPIGLFASKAYIARAGEPQSIEALRVHDWIGYDRSQLIIRGMRSMGVEVDRSFFRTRCDDQVTYWALLRAGCGIGVAPLRPGLADPDLVQLLPDLPVAELPVWLAAHDALRQSPRIRRVWDALAEGLPRAIGGVPAPA
ncbi:LysR family transcriptional regulator [Maritimibacter sp. 55A14]|uniref:LysR family transcriptional regulator n=1 Tax=Maritimibacter sp. 55A14 TaxID=2174844 RepID=UPI000D61CE99|nr:LysR family transcriptional regulator [Maritimibacter sp. 55A14]PWE33616.1 LysR family transcriptional regulator [Maritimibacter sp. 55A14]